METPQYFDQFVFSELNKNKFKLVQITKEVMENRLEEIMSFVNTVRLEGNPKFGWPPEEKEYFLNPMDRKFTYSWMIENEDKKVIMLSFISVYGTYLHMHCAYTHANYRNFGLAKLLTIWHCNQGLKDGIEKWSGWFPKINNGSLILFLRLGVKIEYMRNDIELYTTGYLEEMVNNGYKIYIREANRTIN